MAIEAGVSWEKLDGDGFKLRLSELERGVGERRRAARALADPSASTTSASRSTRTSSSRLLGAGGRLEPARAGARRPTDVHRHERRLPPRGPPASRVDRRSCSTSATEFRLTELQLRADEPRAKAGALADILGLERDGDAVLVGETLVSFLPGGPEGRPELYGERFA